MAPKSKPKLGKFANRFAKSRAATVPNFFKGARVVPETEAQRRARTNKVETSTQARERIAKIEKGLLKQTGQRPFMVALVPSASLVQPPPYKASTLKK